MPKSPKAAGVTYSNISLKSVECLAHVASTETILCKSPLKAVVELYLYRSAGTVIIEYKNSFVADIIHPAWVCSPCSLCNRQDDSPVIFCGFKSPSRNCICLRRRGNRIRNHFCGTSMHKRTSYTRTFRNTRKEN